MAEEAEESYCCVPPGFRFHPTEEELVGYYLARKVASHNDKIDLDIIQEVDLYRIEPWDLQERCSRYGGGEQTTTEWYFFSYKDRKYPSGTRTNRATAAGFWKATGRDKPVMSRCGSRVIGMRKTLVFYRGRAPNGRKTDWIMHEYRLHHHQSKVNDEEGWVVCRAFQKPLPNQINKMPFVFPSSAATPAGFQFYDGGDHHFMAASAALYPALGGGGGAGNCSFVFPQSDDPHLLLESKNRHHHHHHLLMSIPQLVESPTANESCYRNDEHQVEVTMAQHQHQHQHQQGGGGQAGAGAGAIDWNFLDTLLSSHEAEASTSSLL